METKRCSKCGIEKSLTEFYKAKGYRHGIDSQCKKCREEYRRSHPNKHNYIPQIEGEKQCSKCGKFFSITNFATNKTCRDGRGSLCKSCRCENGRKFHFRTFYNITLDEYNKMLESQNYRCAICGNVLSDSRRIHVDHNHTTKQTRALLCGLCNSGLGYFLDSSELLVKAKQYLDYWEMQNERMER